MPDHLRPWGEYHILESFPTHCVKRIVVQPGHRLSYQYHKHRTEHWVVISGRARVTLNEVEKEVGPGAYLSVPCGARHRVACVSKEPLVFVEVWLGDFLGEDDIVRLQDDYARVSAHPSNNVPLPVDQQRVS